MHELDARQLLVEARKSLNPDGKMTCPICGKAVEEQKGRYECGAAQHRTVKAKSSSSGYTFSPTSKTLLSNVKNIAAYLDTAQMILDKPYQHVSAMDIMKQCGIRRRDTARSIRDTIYRAMQPPRMKVRSNPGNGRMQPLSLNLRRDWTRTFYVDFITFRKPLLDSLKIKILPGVPEVRIYLLAKLEPKTDTHNTWSDMIASLDKAKSRLKFPKKFIIKKVMFSYYNDFQKLSDDDFVLFTHFVPKFGDFIVLKSKFEYDSRFIRNITLFSDDSFSSLPNEDWIFTINLRKYLKDELELLEKNLSKIQHGNLGYFLCEYAFRRNLFLSKNVHKPSMEYLYRELIRPRLYELPKLLEPGKGVQ